MREQFQYAEQMPHSYGGKNSHILVPKQARIHVHALDAQFQMLPRAREVLNSLL